MENHLYIKAPYVQFVERRDDCFIVTDCETGRNFELSYGLAKLLEDLSDTPKPLPTELTSEIFDYLIENGLIVADSGGQTDHGFRLKPAAKTLLGLDPLSAHDVADTFAIVGVPYARGNAKSDAVHLAPSVLRNHCAANRVAFKSLFETEFAERLLELGGLSGLSKFANGTAIQDMGDLILHHEESRAACFTKMEMLAASLFKRQNRPFFLGGDHAITLPMVRGAAVLNAPIHYVHIDAHIDNYSHPVDGILPPDTPHNHANFVTRLLELDHVASVHQFGIRGFCNLGDADAHPKLNIQTVTDVRRDKFQMWDLPQDGLFYLSIDIDALDPELAPATNTGVDRGFLYDEFFLLLSNIMTSRNIIGIDLVEIEPKKDVHDKTVEMALKIILFCLAKWS